MIKYLQLLKLVVPTEFFLFPQILTGEASESELIFSSVQHIAAMLARRTDTVKLLVLNEMKDVKLICGVVADVVEILGRRSHDLSKQQSSFIDRLTS